MSLLSHVAKSAGLDRNPMRRGSDRAEAVVRLLSALVFVFVAPAAAGLCGREAYLDGVHAEEQDKAGRHQVDALLLKDAVGPTVSPAAAPTVLVTAEWTAPGGEKTTGWVPAKVGATKGATIPVWVNSAGLPTTAPRPHDETVAQTVAIVVLVPLGIAVVALATQLIVKLTLDRRRYGQWQRDWERVEPVWSGRHPRSAGA